MAGKLYKFTRRLYRRHLMGCYHFGLYDYIRGKDRLSKELPELAVRAAQQCRFPKEIDLSLPPFYLMGSDKYLPMIFSCICSIYYNAKIAPKIFLMEDLIGFTEVALKDFGLSKSQITIIKRDYLDSLVEEKFPRERFPSLREIRDKYFYIRKLLDFNILSPGWKVFIDSDTLFFSRPEEALARMKDGICFSQIDVGGVINAFLSFPEQDILDITGLESLHAGACNTGFIHLNSSDIDWQHLEAVMSLLVQRIGKLENLKGARFHVIEQTIYAILFSHWANFEFLSVESYPVLPKYHKIKNPQHPFSHYIPSSRRFFAYNAVNSVYKRNSLLS